MSRCVPYYGKQSSGDYKIQEDVWGHAGTAGHSHCQGKDRRQDQGCGSLHFHLRYHLFLLDFETVAGKGPCRRFGISLHRPLQNYVSTFSLFSKPPAGPGRQGIFFPLSFKIRITH